MSNSIAKIHKKHAAIAFSGMVLTAALAACNHDHLYTTRLAHGLYVESFSAGIIGNMTAEYLTDSTNFRKYIGSFDDETSWYYYHFKGDSVLIDEMEGTASSGPPRIIKRQIYKVSDLKSPGVFFWK